MSQRVLLTGGAGFIGSHLADALIARGDAVTIIDDLSTGRLANIAHLLDNPRFWFVQDSITNETLLDGLVASSDLVLHFAAVVGVSLVVDDPLRTIETNVLGTHALLRAAGRHRVKVVLASTSEVYGKSSQTPFREDGDSVFGPTSKSRWSYAITKALDEHLALAYHHQHGFPVVIVRLFNTVGPRQTGQYGMVVPRFVQQALRGGPLTVYGDGQQSRCFCDVADAVRAILGLCGTAAAEGEVFNIGSSQEVTILELARRVLALTAPHRSQGTEGGGGIRLVPYSEAYGAGFEDMQRRVPDTSKTATAIGWRPSLSLDETLDRVIAYYNGNSSTEGPVAGAASGVTA